MVALDRGEIARIEVTIALDPYLSLPALARYSSLSVTTLRAYLALAPDEALPAYYLPGKILVRRGDFDRWMAKFHSRGRPNVLKALKEMGL